MSEAFLSPQVGGALLLVLSVAWVLLGRLWGRKARDVEGFMLAGRNVGMALGAATAVATWITSNTTMLAPQFALQLGVWGMLAYCTASFGLFLFAPMAERIRQLMPRGFTSVEFFRRRYGPAAGGVFLLISLFYSLTWMVSMGMAGGLLLEALAGIPYLYGMTVILAVCTLYTLFGGLYAVIGTDFIQSWLILAGIVVVAVAVLPRISPEEVWTVVDRERPMLLSVLFPAALIAIFNNLLFGLGEIFHNNVWWSRVFAMREGIAGRAFRMAGFLWLPVPIVAGFLGLAALALGVPVGRPDMVGPVVAAEVLGYGGALLVFVLVFCSLASSIDSLMAATADMITKDIIEPTLLRDAGEKRLRLAASLSIVGLGALTWWLCALELGTLATVLFFAGPLVGSTIWPILTGLYLRRANGRGALVAMVAGSSLGLVAYFTWGWFTASLIGTVVSMICVIAFTVTSRERFDWPRLAGEVPAPADAPAGTESAS